jgi:vacuolar-type H+-ATPase subunit B/Vma2
MVRKSVFCVPSRKISQQVLSTPVKKNTPGDYRTVLVEVYERTSAKRKTQKSTTVVRVEL